MEIRQVSSVINWNDVSQYIHPIGYCKQWESMNSNNLDTPYKNSIEPKKPDTKEYVLYESISGKSPNRQNESQY